MLKLFLFIMISFISLSCFSCCAAVHKVSIKKFKFEPAGLVVEVGDTVIWTNEEKRQYHNVWFKNIDKEEPDYLFPDETYTKTFFKQGKHTYECGPHPKMKGHVNVLLPATAQKPIK